MKIKTQAILGTAFLAVSVLSLGALILFKQFKAESKVKMIVGVYNQRILLARDLQELILRLSRSERNYLLFDDPIYLNRILATGDKIDQTARKLSDVESPTGKEIIKQFIQERKDYRGMTNQMIGYMHLNRSDKSKEITRLDLRGATDKMDELLDNIIENNRESISQAESDALSQMVQTRYFTVGSLLFVVLFTAGVWIVVFKINRALTEFRSGFETLEERKFSTIPINPMKRDELSLIGHSFNRMSTAIKNYTENLRKSLLKTN